MAILMILSFAASMIAVPNASAQSTREFNTWPFVDAVPKTAGVGQPVLINWGLLNYLFRYDDGWNVTLQITYPNGKVENHSGMTWSTGTLGKKISFMETGNYTLQCVYDGEYYVYNTVNNALTGYYKPSKSENLTLQIVDNWKPNHPGHSLPTEYWTRPVDSQLREWYTIMGSWVARPPNLYAPWNDAPESAHILWSMPIGDTMGGLSGGDNGPIGYQGGDAYDGKFAGSVIIAGVLYFNKYVSNNPNQAIVAVDLHTGKVLWEKSFGPNMGMGTGRIGRGQILTFISENNRGTWAYLWLTSGTNMYALDAKTGESIYNMTNVPSGDIYIGPNGEMLKYSVATYNGVQHILQWNSTHVVNNGSLTGTANAWGTQARGKTYNAQATGDRVPGVVMASGYDINASTGIAGGTGNSIGSIVTAFPTDRIIYGNHSNAGMTLTGISLDPENAGAPIFTRRTWAGNNDWADVRVNSMQYGWAAFSNDPYVAVFWTNLDRVNYAFSLDTGRFMWKTESQHFADAWSDTPTFQFGPEKHIAYGKLYEASVGGILYCYNATTGTLLWTYEATDKYNESYHSENWWLIITAISSGKIYLGHMVHSYQVPISRGAPFLAVDAETGDLVWEIDGAFRQTRWGGRAVMGDSIIATADIYDQQVYAIGKGPSKMTVSAPNIGIVTGTTALISGTVMDVSPGTEQDNVIRRFSNGVPAVSEQSMSEWMLYVYKQFSRPMDTTGVEVVVFAQQGEHVIDIGRTTSDANGRFSISWTPPADATGEWDIYAYFDGSASYYGSFAKTEMAVSAAPVVDEVETPPYEWYIVGMGLAILAVVIIFGLLSLKKK